MAIGSLLLGAVYYQLGDPLYILNYELKMKILQGLPLQPLLRKLAWIALAYVLPAVAVLWLSLASKKKMAIQLLFVLIVAQAIGFNFKKSLAEYQITYGYGYKGASLVYEHLPKTGSVYFAEWAVIPPRGSLIHYRLDTINNHLSLEEWKRFVIEEKPDALVCGPALNTIEQMNRLYSLPEFKEFMNGDYNLIHCGDYDLYRKKKREDCSPPGNCF
jgi:hypothetical protein